MLAFAYKENFFHLLFLSFEKVLLKMSGIKDSVF